MLSIKRFVILGEVMIESLNGLLLKKEDSANCIDTFMELDQFNLCEKFET